MTLPASGTIYLSQIKAEFGGPDYALSRYYRGGGYVTTNNTNVPTSGQISFAQFYGAAKVVPGSLSYGPGTYYIAIPAFTWITFDVRAGGGGGGASDLYPNPANPGGAGGTSYVSGGGASVSAGGGAGGQPTSQITGVNYPGGAPRAATGYGNYGAGGGTGGVGGSFGDLHGQDGGYGGRQVTSYSTGQLTVGATLTIAVGGGGAGGSGSNMIPGNAGGGGAIYISWG